MEALAYLKAPGTDAVEQVQRRIAASQAYQADPSCAIPQLAVLTHIIDVASSIRQGNTKIMMNKLKDMQSVMDEALKDSSWSTVSDAIAIPIKRTSKSSSIISQDTRMILGIGEDGGDNLMMTFLNKKDAYSITLVTSTSSYPTPKNILVAFLPVWCCFTRTLVTKRDSSTWLQA